MNPIKWRSDNLPVTETDIVKLEGVVGIVLPDSYKEIVKSYDNGRPRPRCFDLKNREGVVFNSLLSFSIPGGDNIFEVYNRTKSDIGKRVLPFADDPFGNLICFDYRETDNNPPIVFWDHEADSDAGEESLKFVANSFDEFLDMLYEPDD